MTVEKSDVRLSSQNLKMLEEWRQSVPTQGLQRVPSPCMSTYEPTEVGSMSGARSTSSRMSRRSMACSTVSAGSIRKLCQLEKDVQTHTQSTKGYGEMLATVERLNKAIEARRAEAQSRGTLPPLPRQSRQKP
eukprot:TRINITY_DN1791_c0_g1_i1.p1 TRINITY_DN1791_c0_g1~~TRINITY_DN1791_c0_g1_i1.p1  ORF type:complete len:133 (+),score=16.67 TRINITY_DN1791_c0_g1_i1:139-537(+)